MAELVSSDFENISITQGKLALPPLPLLTSLPRARDVRLVTRTKSSTFAVPTVSLVALLRPRGLWS